MTTMMMTKIQILNLTRGIRKKYAPPLRASVLENGSQRAPPATARVLVAGAKGREDAGWATAGAAAGRVPTLPFFS